jgi:hypothetical protein
MDRQLDLPARAEMESALAEERLHRRQAQLRLRGRAGPPPVGAVGRARPARSTRRCSFSPLRLRYLQPFDEHARGGSGSHVVDASIERVERHCGYRIRVRGTTWQGDLTIDADEVIAATGFRTPLRDLPALGVATVNDGRLPAQTPWWESVTVPGIFFAGNVTQASSGLRKHGATSSSGSVHGFRYNARLVAQRIAETVFGRRRERRPLQLGEVVPFLAGELARAPELWSQKAYLARVVAFDPSHGIRDEGIVPLAEFVDRDGGDACAVSIEYDAGGAIVPALYVRHDGRLAEHLMPPHPLHAFDGDEYRRELGARLDPLLA